MTAYVERAAGRWECWTYEEGRRRYLKFSHDMKIIQAFCQKYGYRLLLI